MDMRRMEYGRGIPTLRGIPCRKYPGVRAPESGCLRRPKQPMAQYRTEEIESTDLRAARLDRAFNDPVIVHRYTADWAPPQDHSIYSNIRTARLQQARETLVEERITEATVPETAVYLATATLDSSYATPELVDIYQHAYRDYLQSWTGADLNDLPAPLNKDPELTDYEKDMYRCIRTAIKADRDRWFVEHRYDDLDLDMPRTYWTDGFDPVDGDDMDATIHDVIDNS